MNKEIPLHPENSLVPTINFTHEGKEYYIGIWEFLLLGDSWAMVTYHEDSSSYRAVGTVTPMSIEDVDRFGGKQSYIKRHLNNWNQLLRTMSNLPDETKENKYPLWHLYTSKNIKYNSDTEQLEYNS